MDEEERQVAVQVQCGSDAGLGPNQALMEPDNSSAPQQPARTPDPSAHNFPSFSGVDASSSLRSSRRRSRSSRTSERESLEEEIKRTVKTLRAQVDTERRRADNAERKVREMTSHLKAVNDARLEALRDASRAKEELRMYKIQLDTAQREIYRAQDVIALVDRQRHSAETEAAKNRTKARQLNETILIQAAREEAYRLGMKEGLDRGRAIALADEPYDEEEGEEDEEYSVDESRSSSPQSEHHSYQEPPRPRSMIAPSQRSGHSRANSRRNASSSIPIPPPPDILPINPPTAAPTMHATTVRPPSTYVPNMRAPSPNAPSMRAASTRPPSMRVPSPQPTLVYPPASTNASSRRASSINLAEQMGRPVSVRTITPTPQHPAIVPPPDNLIPVLGADMRIRLPPPHEFTLPRTPERPQSPAFPAASESSYTSQDPLPVPPRAHTPQQQQQRKSRHRRNSSSGSSSLSHLELVNNPYMGGIRSPMSIIEEVSSQTASPNTHQSPRHQRSFSENSIQQRAPPTSNYGEEAQSQYRPKSRSSYAGSWIQPQGPSQDDRRSDRRSQRSSDNDAPNIQVQPPSLSNKTDSLRGSTSLRDVSPAPSQRVPPPSVYETHEAGSSQSHGYAPGMPGGYASDYYAVPPQPSSTAPPVIPTITPLRYQPRTPDGHMRYEDDDGEVSSALSAETLTTPRGKYRAPPESEWGEAPAGSSSTGVWHLPEAAIGVSMVGSQSGRSSARGSNR